MNNKTEWVEVAISVMSSYADAVANFLIEQGSNGIVEEDSKTEKDSVILKAYLKNDGIVHSLLEKTALYLGNLPELKGVEGSAPQIRVNHIPDEDWNKKWKSFFEPVKVTDHIVIKPSWRKYRQKRGEVIITLDPGMAFGTGTHPSTRMCLRAIEELAGNFQDMEDTSLLDVGTGSGILAIASALLGIKKVVGIDNDYQAVECSIKNAKENAVTENVFLSQCPLKKIEGKFSIVAANILPHVLIGMLAELVSSMKDDGFLVLSGILKEKAEEVRVAFLKHLELVKELNEEEWACLIFKK